MKFKTVNVEKMLGSKKKKKKLVDGSLNALKNPSKLL